MRKIRDVLRLGLGHGLPQRAVGRSLGLSQAAVSHYLGRARRAGLGWPLPESLDDDRLEALLFPPPSQVPVEQRPVPDWPSHLIGSKTASPILLRRPSFSTLPISRD